MNGLPSRKTLNKRAWEQMRLAQVSPVKMTALFCMLLLGLQILGNAVTRPRMLAIFVWVLSTLTAWVLKAGYALFFMDMRHEQPLGYKVLFDGFSFTGKIISLHLVMGFLVSLWGMLLVIPGVTAAYRYRFALYDLCEDPRIDIMEALRRSCRQTRGWKSRLFSLDISHWGWFLLANLPKMLLLGMALGIQEGTLPGTFLRILPEDVPPMGLALLVLCGLWEMVVSLCYLPKYRWMDLAYFDMARNALHRQTPV